MTKSNVFVEAKKYLQKFKSVDGKSSNSGTDIKMEPAFKQEMKRLGFLWDLLEPGITIEALMEKEDDMEVRWERKRSSQI